MEQQGDRCSSGKGTEGSEGFPQLRPVSRTPTQSSEPHGGRGPLMAARRCQAGVKGQRGHYPGERRRLGPQRAPGKARGLAAGAAVAATGS